LYNLEGICIKTQMGTNLLNLFPSFPDKRTCHGARLRLFRLAALHSRRFRFVSCFLTLNHPLQPFTTVISGFPLGFLADSFREGVAWRLFSGSILRWRCFPVTFLVLRLPISPKTSPDLRHVPFCTSNFNYLKNAQRLLLCRPFAARPGLATRSCIFGFLPSFIAFEGDSFWHPFQVPLRFPFRESPSWLLCSNLERSGCNQSDNESIFQSKHIRSTFQPLRALSLSREDFLRKLSGTCEPYNLRPFATTFKRTLGTFRSSDPHWIAPCWPEPRPICGADLATCSIWLPIQLRTFGLFHHFWVTLYGWPDESNVIQVIPVLQLFLMFYTNDVLTWVINNC